MNMKSKGAILSTMAMALAMEVMGGGNSSKYIPDPDRKPDPNHGAWHPTIKRMINFNEAILGGSYAMDYNFLTNNPKYLIGMSVPPVMTARIADEIYAQWLSKLNGFEKTEAGRANFLKSFETNA